MAKQVINIGSADYAGDGESIRVAFNKANANFDELYLRADEAFDGDYTNLVNKPTIPVLNSVNTNIVPDTDNLYDLGSTGLGFRNLYLSGDTIGLGGLEIKNVSGNLNFDGENIITTSTLNVAIQEIDTTVIPNVNITELADVDASNPAVNEVLKWNGTSWTNQTDLGVDAVSTLEASLAAVAISGEYSDLINSPTLSAVATSGEYDDLLNKPVIPTNLNQLAITTDTDFGSNKILYANMFDDFVDLPSASTYPGMFAHIDSTGKAYYSQDGEWIELANKSQEFLASTDLSAGAPVMLNTDSSVEAIQGSFTNADYNVYSQVFSSVSTSTQNSTTFEVDPFNNDVSVISLNNLLYVIIDSGSGFNIGSPISLPIGGSAMLKFDKNVGDKLVLVSKNGADVYVTIGTRSGSSIAWGTPELISDTGGKLDIAQVNQSESKFVVQTGSVLTVVTPDYAADSFAVGTGVDFPIASEPLSGSINGFDLDPLDPALVAVAYGAKTGAELSARIICGRIAGDSIDFTGSTASAIIQDTVDPEVVNGGVTVRFTGEQPGKFVVAMMHDDNASFGTNSTMSVAAAILTNYDNSTYDIGQTVTPHSTFGLFPTEKSFLFVHRATGVDFITTFMLQSRLSVGDDGHEFVVHKINGLDISFTGPFRTSGSFEDADERMNPLIAWTNDGSGKFYRETNTRYDGGVNADTFQSTVVRAEVSVLGSNIRPEDIIGLAAESCLAGETAFVNLPGAIDSNQSGLTTGTDYYVSDEGTLTSNETLTNYKIGKALSTNSLLIETPAPGKPSFNDLKDTPVIPTDIGNLNDASGLLFDGNYNDLINTPTALSDFANDLDYASIVGGAIQNNGLPELPTQTLDIKGSVFADDSSVMVDGVNGLITGRVENSVIVTNLILGNDGTQAGSGSAVTLSGGNGETNGGTIIIGGGVGTQGVGGLVTIGGGPGSAGDGGAVNLGGGTGSINGGHALLSGGNGSGGDGGTTYIGAGTGSVNGGAVSITAGSGPAQGGVVEITGGGSSNNNAGNVIVKGGESNLGTPGNTYIRGGTNDAGTVFGNVYIGDSTTTNLYIGESESIAQIGIGQHNVNNTTTTNLYGDIVFRERNVLFSGSDISFEDPGLNTASIDFTGTIISGTNFVESDTTGITGADAVSNIVTLTQAEYDNIGSPNASTVYIIVG